MRILVAPDKFKGTLTAHGAATAMVAGWSRGRPTDSVQVLPITDGGDGFGQIMAGLIGSQTLKCKTVDAAHRSCVVDWWWEAKTKTAVIESANVIGLAMLPPGKFHTFELDTFGLGKVIRTAEARGARKIMIGIGGSATNDGGFGVARALGWGFFDAADVEIQEWTGLERLARIQPPRRKLSAKVIVAMDVKNPLLGLRGASRVYGPQKGLKPCDFALAEKCLRKLARVSRHPATIPGSGAAGGLGFGLMAFLDAGAESGFSLFARQAKLDRKLRGVDLVLTGEGAIDRSTFMGKGVGEIVRRCRQLRIPCIVFAGKIEGERKKFFGSYSLVESTSNPDAKARPAFWLEKLAETASGKLQD